MGEGASKERKEKKKSLEFSRREELEGQEISIG